MADNLILTPGAGVGAPAKIVPIPARFLAGTRQIAGSYLFRAIVQALLTIWVVLTFTFFLIRLMPSNPIEAYIDQHTQNGNMTYEQAAAKAAIMFGSDVTKPWPEQYVTYVGNLLRGNLGFSIVSTDTPVVDILANYLPWTLFSVGLSLLISFIIGIGLGTLTAYWRNSVFDHFVNTIASFISSVPNYLIAFLIIYIFGVQLQWFDVGQARGPYSAGIVPAFSLAFFLDVLSHALLPLITYTVSSFGGWTLSMKNSTLGTLGEDYIQVARARGLRPGRIITSYVGRNAVLPLFTQLALSVAYVIGGSVIIETIFLYPGIGTKLTDAVNQRDYTVMQGIFLVITAAVVIANLLTDFLYSRLDPRVRLAKG